MRPCVLTKSYDNATGLNLMKKTLTNVVSVQRNVSSNRVRYENPSPRIETE